MVILVQEESLITGEVHLARFNTRYCLKEGGSFVFPYLAVTFELIKIETCHFDEHLWHHFLYTNHDGQKFVSQDPG
jgi:hypothetical protein